MRFNSVNRPGPPSNLVLLFAPLLILTSLWAGCAARYHVVRTARPQVGPFTPRPTLATVCILRPQWFGALATFLHYDNGRLVGATQGSGVFFCYLAQPGWHRLTARSDNDATLMLHAVAGGRYFARLHVRIGPDGLSRTSEAQARRLIPRLVYVVTHPANDTIPAPHREPVPALGTPAGRHSI